MAGGRSGSLPEQRQPLPYMYTTPSLPIPRALTPMTVAIDPLGPSTPRAEQGRGGEGDGNTDDKPPKSSPRGKPLRHGRLVFIRHGIY